MATTAHLPRRLTVATAATAALLLVVALVLPEVRETVNASREASWRDPSFEELLVRLCALTALAAGGCWWLGVLRLVAAARPGADTARLPVPVGVPPWLRRLVLVACGTALVAVPVSPALASGGGGGPGTDPVAALALPAATGDLPTTGPDGLPLPDRVAGTTARTLEAPRADPRPTVPPRPAPAPRPDRATAVRVAPGDSLWRIAEAQLLAGGEPTGDAAVAARWQEIYAANAGRIGPDPDLVLPGQVLDLDRP